MDRPKCDYCKGFAVINIQSGVVVYKIYSGGEYDFDEFHDDGETNRHLCRVHAKKEGWV